MRIRKNAKISTLIDTNASFSNSYDECLLQKNLCQLNQSPWDIITFPSSDSSSSLHQSDDNEVYYNVNLTGNGSLVDSVGDFESVASVKTYECEHYDLDDLKYDYQEILGFQEIGRDEVKEEIVLCGESDEKGWQCGKEVKNGNTMCERHIELQNDTVWTTKKKSRPGPGPVNGLVSGTRHRQPKKGASTSPYEFYYYSGFGPSWGKKRGAVGSTTTNTCNELPTKSKDMSSCNDDMDIGKGMAKLCEPEICKVGPMEMGLASINDDKKKDKTRIIGKKRGRKPIKARSLKSLM